MPRRTVYGLSAFALFFAAILLFVFWMFPLAAIAFVLGVWLLRLGERESPTR